MDGKTKYAVVDNNTIVYSSPKYEQAKRVLDSFNKAYPAAKGHECYRLYEMTEVEVES